MLRIFENIIDFAGLFPPASATMEETVLAYARYRDGPDQAWLGRFVVASSRLAELDAAVVSTGVSISEERPWPLSVVMGVNVPEAVQQIADFESEGITPLVIEAVEVRAGSPGHVTVLAEQLAPRWERFLELSHSDDYQRLLKAIAAAGMSAKIRTGGTSPELFPSTHQLAQFLSTAVRNRVPFKATAGLHHPYRGSYPLCYDLDSPMHIMFGFVGLLMAVAVLRHGSDAEVAARVLADDYPSAFVWSHDALTWRDYRIPLPELAWARQSFRGFGSCSFREPVDELAMSAIR